MGLPRSTWYFAPIGERATNLALMRRIDEQYLRTPFYGSRKLGQVLGVNRKRVRRLMRLMGLEAIYPKRSTSRPAAGHTIYPYLLRDLPRRQRAACGSGCFARRTDDLLQRDDEGGDDPCGDIAQPQHGGVGVGVKLGESWNRIDDAIGQENQRDGVAADHPMPVLLEVSVPYAVERHCGGQ